MGALKGLFGEFSKGGVGVNPLRSIVTPVFSTIFEWGTKALNAIHKGFLYIVIGALTAYIAMRPVIAKIKEFAESANFMTGLKIVLAALAIPFIIIGVVVGVAVLAVGLFIAAFIGIAAGVVYVIGAIEDFVSGAATALVDWVSGAADAAGDFIAGLVQGISAGASAVAAAVKGRASGALNAFTSTLGIHSPSTIMLEHGEDNIAGAAATGIDKGSVKVNDAMARMGSAEPGGGGAGKGGKGSGRVYNITNHIHVADGTDFRVQFVRMLEDLDAEAPTEEAA